MNTTKVIGMCGKKGVGKNFVADLLKAELENSSIKVKQMAFAEPLKEFLITCLGLNREWTYGSDNDKNNPTNVRWETMDACIKAKYPGKTGFMTHREVMQIFGTDVMRDNWDKNIWVNTLNRRIEQTDAEFVIVTDVRFPNEIEILKARGGRIWLVDGPQRGGEAAKKDKHASEMLTETPVQYDVVILNRWETTADELRSQIREGIRNRV
jgi:hypothetical protein